MSERGLESHGRFVVLNGKLVSVDGVPLHDHLEKNPHAVLGRMDVAEQVIIVLQEAVEHARARVSRVAEATLATAGAVLSVEDLNLDAEGPYRLIMTLVNPTEDFVGYYLFFNGDREEAHYWRQFVADADEVRTSGRRNDPRLIGLDPGETALVEGTLARGPDGLVRCSVSVNRGAPAEIISITHKIAWAVSKNVTKVEAVADVEAGIGPGSTLIIHDTGATV